MIYCDYFTVVHLKQMLKYADYGIVKPTSASTYFPRKRWLWESADSLNHQHRKMVMNFRL